MLTAATAGIATGEAAVSPLHLMLPSRKMNPNGRVGASAVERVAWGASGALQPPRPRVARRLSQGIGVL